MSGPRIETARLVLDLHTAERFEALAAMWADPAVLRHIGEPALPQESWMRLLRYRGLWPVLGYGYWCVSEKASGRFVGDIGFADFRRDIDPSIRGVPEAGWVFATWSHGRGFGREALAAAHGWLDAEGAYRRCVSIIAPDNVPSLRLASGAGFRNPRPTRLGSKDMLLLERYGPDDGGRKAE